MPYRNVDQNDERDANAVLSSNPDETAPEMCIGCTSDCETCSLVE